MHGPLSPRVLLRNNWSSTVSRLEIDVETVLVVLNRDFQMKENVHTLSVLRRLSYRIAIQLYFSIVIQLYFSIVIRLSFSIVIQLS